jgi:hypothetical protein
MTPILANFRTRTLSRGDVMVRCGPVTFRIITSLLAARAPLTIGQLCEHVYSGDTDGGPDTADMVVRTTLAHIRDGYYQSRHRSFVCPKLAPLGLSIVNHFGSGYTIAVSDPPVSAEAAE